MTGYNKVFVDTAPFIYYIEGSISNPDYSERAKNFFKNSYENGTKLVTSVITIEEYEVFPYKAKKQEFIDLFESLIRIVGIQVINIDKVIAEKAAHIRAEYSSFKSMDSLQLATACISKCDLFLTNDKQLRQFKEIKCITIDEL